MSLSTNGNDITVLFKGTSDGKIVKEEHEKKTNLQDDEVLIKITHSGVCGTDLHYKNANIVLGHEGIGQVEAIGSNVQKFKVGDRAGFGYVHGGCNICFYCTKGLHWHCQENGARFYGRSDHDQGSFATHAAWPQTLLRQIPAEISSAEAAPLMCAGQTVWSPLVRYGLKPTDRVGVVGIGGLGHLAIQFANKMGNEVIVLSGSEGKREEAMKLGAREFYATKGKDTLDIGERLNHLVVTTSQLPDWDLILPILAPFAKIYILTVTGDNLILPVGSLMMKEIAVICSCTCSVEEVDQMLRFAAKHNIRPIIQEFPASVEGVTEALEKLDKGEIRYRGVLVI